MNNKVSMLYIKLGFIWLMTGMMFGLWMGINESFDYATAHAHANLVGFVVSVFIGLVLHNFPQIARSKLTSLQFLVYQIGAVGLVAGKIVVVTDHKNIALVAGSSVILIVAMAMFLWMLLGYRNNADNSMAEV